MKKVLLLSDTHSHWDARFAHYAQGCDEIWHAGDIGDPMVADQLEALAPMRAVHGNIDSTELRRRYPEVLRFECEGVEVLMKHIGGYPGRYDRSIRSSITMHPPQLFISGHSHILKVMMDHTLHCLHINPGAAGLYGQQTVRTLIRFVLDAGNIRDLEVIELR